MKYELLGFAPNDTMNEEEDWEEEEGEEEEEERKGVPSLATLAGRKMFTMEGVREIFKDAGIEGFYDRLRRNHILNYFQNVTMFCKSFEMASLDCDLANEYDDNLQLCGDGFTVWFARFDGSKKHECSGADPCSVRFSRSFCRCGRCELWGEWKKENLVYSFSVCNEDCISETYWGCIVIEPGGEINVYDQYHNRLGMDGYVTNVSEHDYRLYVRDIVKFVRLV